MAKRPDLFGICMNTASAIAGWEGSDLLLRLTGVQLAGKVAILLASLAAFLIVLVMTRPGKI